MQKNKKKNLYVSKISTYIFEIIKNIKVEEASSQTTKHLQNVKEKQ